MKSDLPPPVTRKSSKAELWEELECSRNEIDDLQSRLNQCRDEAIDLRNQAAIMDHQLRVIRATTELLIKPVHGKT